MKCDLEPAGYQRFTCRRKGCPAVVVSPYSINRIHSLCFGVPRWHEFGGWLEIAFGVFGIHKHGYVWLKQKLGFAPKCGCPERQQKLDDLGAELAAKFSPESTP